MIIGVDLGGTNIRAGLINNGKLLEERHYTLTDKDSLDKTISQLTAAIAPLINAQVKGIGIGVPSVVDTEKGIVYNVVNIPSWKKVELKTILEETFHIPAFVNNDVNCFVLGEHLYGVARDYANIVGLTLGTGLGAGIIIHNKLYNGRNCGAGEIGMLPYLDHTYEFYTSSEFFITKHGTTAEIAHNDALLKSATALDQWKEFGFHMGNLLKAVVYTYDPEMIVLGGSIAKAYSFFEETMMDEFSACYYKESVRNIKIICSVSDNISLLGAASLVNGATY
jgi:glucokinase